MTKSQEKRTDTSSGKSSLASEEEALKPFQEASLRFLQANFSAQQNSINQSTEAYLDYLNKIRKVEHEAYDAMMEVARKHASRTSERPAATMEEMYWARAQSQMEYENEARRVYSETQSKLRDVVQKAYHEDGSEAIKQFVNQRQDAYREFLADLQKAWSGSKALDPQSVKAIASHILCTLGMC